MGLYLGVVGGGGGLIFEGTYIRNHFCVSILMGFYTGGLIFQGANIRNFTVFLVKTFYLISRERERKRERERLCFLLKSTISDKSNWDSLYFHKNVPKIYLYHLKVPEFPLTLTQYWIKPEKAMPGSANQEWAKKFAISIE